LAPLVLIVEDDAPIRVLFQRIIERVQCDPILAANGEEALRILETQQPALVLLDLGLPGEISGESVLDFVRETPRLQDTRVLVISAYPNLARDLKDPSLADAMVTKPIRPTELMKIITNLLAN
jgi:two-component system alkaline phosphatase synthesis response regulator PhoP